MYEIGIISSVALSSLISLILSFLFYYIAEKFDINRNIMYCVLLICCFIIGTIIGTSVFYFLHTH